MADEQFSFGHLVNTANQVFHSSALQDVATRARLQGTHNIVILAMDGQDDGSDFWKRYVYAAGGFNPIQVRH